MKIALTIALLVASAVAAQAQYYGSNRNSSYGSNSGLYGSGSNSNSNYVQPYYNSNTGSMTGGHYRTNPNNTQMDNYSTRGNLNPYTGSYGTRTPRY